MADRELNKAPDSAKIYIYIFNSDSLDKYQKLKHSNGILKHSLLKKIKIQLNKVKGHLDTIYVK
jgi:ribosome-binding factor A